MRRREFISLTAGAAILVLGRRSSAQEAARLPIVGILLSQAGATNPSFVGILAQLKKLGYEDGRNVRIVVRDAAMKYDRLPSLAAELVGMHPDVIVSIDTPPTRAAIAATKQIPIVMLAGDPIATGFVRNLAHPGENVTGVGWMFGEIAPKRLQIFREAVPTLKRVAALFNPNDPLTAPQRLEIERARPLLDFETRFFPVRAAEELKAVFDELAAWHADGVFWLIGQELAFVKPSIDLAAGIRVPVAVPRLFQISAGAFLCYAPDSMSLFAAAAAYVDRILRGAKPGELPIQQPTHFRLIINLKTAKALGLTVPQPLLSRADEVIE